MPAALHVIKTFAEEEKAPREGTIIDLTEKYTTIGRLPRSTILLPPGSVSKEHARIERVAGERYTIEDRQSRNSTFLNGEELPPFRPRVLCHKDHIRVCGFEAIFLDLGQMESSSFQAALTPTADTLLETQPTERLRGLLEVSSTLARTRNFGAIPSALAESLFKLFRQADRCFVVVIDEGNTSTGGRHLRPLLTRTRTSLPDKRVRFSRSIVNHCIDTRQSLLFVDIKQVEDILPDNQSVDGLGIRSAMCVPLCNSYGEPFGVLQLDSQDSAKQFRKEDLELFTGVANQASIALENARLQQTEKIQNDLKTARTVLECFLPSDIPKVPGYEFATHYQPAFSIGGDYYGFLPQPSGDMLVALGDVSGKGISAALLVAKLSSDMVACAQRHTDPALLMTALNDQMYPFTSPMHKFVTLALLRLDPVNHHHILVNAGHTLPQIYRPTTSSLVPAMNSTQCGYPVGIEDVVNYQSLVAPLEPGEILLMFSDGVTDAGTSDGAPFGMKRILQAVAHLGHTSPRVLIETIVRAVHDYAGNGVADDDIAILAVQRTR